MVHFNKRITSDIKFFKGGEISGANKIVLIFDNIVGKIKLNKSGEITSDKFLSMYASDSVSGYG